MTRLLARIVLAAFVGMIPIVLDAPAAIAMPHSPMDCVPVGVTTKPDGSVWAVEDCAGGKIEYRFGSPKSK
jgi:hypothetical protein